MPPRSVGVAIGLPLRAVLVEEPLAVRIGGYVGRVDSNLAAHLRVLLAERSRERVEAARQHFTLPTEPIPRLVTPPEVPTSRGLFSEIRRYNPSVGIGRSLVGWARSSIRGCNVRILGYSVRAPVCPADLLGPFA